MCHVFSLALAQILLVRYVDMVDTLKKPASIHPRIVIMDSDTRTVNELMKSLGEEGYRAEGVEQTDRLFAEIKKGQIDVLILDVEAWGTKGCELISIIKKMNRSLPLIITSSDDSIEVAAKVREQGVFFYTLKPLDITEMKSVLKNALSRPVIQQPGPVPAKKREKKVARDDEILHLEAAGKMLQLSKQTVSRLARTGDLPATKICGRWCFAKSQLLEWLRVNARGNQRNYSTLILETINDGVAVVDRRLKIVSCNSAYLKSHDVPREHVIGEHCYRVSRRSVAPCDESICPVRQAFKTKQPVKLMHINYDREGRERYCDVFALPMKDKKGKVSQAIEIVRDNTEIYNVNKHLNWIMDFFAHELKGTLGPVMMNISALADERLARTISPEKQSEMLLSALCSLKLLHDMIRNYVISYRSENGQLECRIRQCDVYTQVLQPVIEDFTPILHRRQMAIETLIRGDCTIYCDVALMRIAFSNLINSAIKYGSIGTKIVCESKLFNKIFEVIVFSEGIGIEKEKLHSVFERFARFDETSMNGTGLGLHIVKMITELHHGEVKVESGYIIDKKPVTYEELHAYQKLYDKDDTIVKKFARFTLKFPLITEG